MIRRRRSRKWIDIGTTEETDIRSRSTIAARIADHEDDSALRGVFHRWLAPAAATTFLTRSALPSSAAAAAAESNEQQYLHQDENNDDALKQQQARTANSTSATTITTATTTQTRSSGGAEDGAASMTALSDVDVDEYSFFDRATIYVRAGSGGQGGNTYTKKSKNQQRGPPDGGNGGKGGDVVLVVDKSLNTLAGLASSGSTTSSGSGAGALRPNAYGGSGAAVRKMQQKRKNSSHIMSFRAENGSPGSGNNKNGRYGKDCTIRVPPGTTASERVNVVDDEKVNNNDDGNASSSTKLVELGRVTKDNPTLVVAKGGEGGEGTAALLVGNRGAARRPRIGATGGERKILELTLQVVADVAIVGVPSCGKSVRFCDIFSES